MRNPVTQDKVVRTFARGLPEQAGEMIRTKADLVGQGREGQIVAHVRVHEVRQAGQLSLRQSMGWRSRMTRSRYRTIVAQQVNGKHLGSGVRIQVAAWGGLFQFTPKGKSHVPQQRILKGRSRDQGYAVGISAHHLLSCMRQQVLA